MLTHRTKGIAMLHTAQKYSLWLTRQLDNKRLNLDVLNNWLVRPIDLSDFRQFADWHNIQSTENETELAKQLRLLRQHVMAHILIRD